MFFLPKKTIPVLCEPPYRVPCKTDRHDDDRAVYCSFPETKLRIPLGRVRTPNREVETENGGGDRERERAREREREFWEGNFSQCWVHLVTSLFVSMSIRARTLHLPRSGIWLGLRAGAGAERGGEASAGGGGGGGGGGRCIKG